VSFAKKARRSSIESPGVGVEGRSTSVVSRVSVGDPGLRRGDLEPVLWIGEMGRSSPGVPLFCVNSGEIS
jgi:hypothetical protein